MTDDADDDKPGDAKPRPATDPPQTRKHEVAPEPAAQAAPDLHTPMTYPDDGGLAAGLRRIDRYIGIGEQALLVTIFAAVVLTAAVHAILDRVAHIQLDFKGEVVHVGTFAIAIFGTVFATQQARHLAMDLVSRRLSARNRLFLKIVLAVFTAFIVCLMIHASFSTIAGEEKTPQHAKLFSSVQVAWIIPIGGFLMLAHLFLHTVIDLDYLVRGKTPPERARSGH